jgi:hypothetical protein
MMSTQSGMSKTFKEQNINGANAYKDLLEKPTQLTRFPASQVSKVSSLQA